MQKPQRVFPGVLLLGAALALGLCATPAAAQDREGFYFGLGGGVGTADATCDECGEGDRETGGAFYLKGGWTASPRLLVGAEFNLWMKTFDVEDDVEMSISMYNLTGTLSFYPSPSNGFFVKGGAGLSFVDTEISEPGATLTLDLGTGFGVLAGVGYDIRLGRRVALTPAVNYWYGAPGDLKVLGETFATNWSQNVVDFTIGITFP